MAVSWVAQLWSRLNGRAPTSFKPGDHLVCGGEVWVVSAVITERGAGRQWPTLQLSRDSHTIWITVDGEEIVRFEPLTDVRLDAEGRLIWNGRVYTISARGSYRVTSVTGATDAAVGDRASYLILTNPRESEHWISVERWEDGLTEVSVARPCRIDRISHPRHS